jgi:hypothetical protein
MPRDGAIIWGGELGVLWTLRPLHPAQLTFFRYSQVRLIYRLDLVLVLPIAFRKLLDDLKDLRRSKSHTLSGQQLNFFANPEFVRYHSIYFVRCAFWR